MNKTLFNRVNMMWVTNPVFPAGQSLYSCPTDGSKSQVLVPIGTPVFWDPITNLSVDALTVCNLNRINAGVAVDTNGDGMPDDIARVFNDYIDPCGIESATADIPSCGRPPITDIMFDCLERNKTYSLIIRWRDNRTEVSTTQGDWDSVQVKFKVPDTICTTCPAGMNCKEAVCELIDDATGKTKYANFKDRFLGRRLTRRPIPVDILGLESNAYQFNLAPVLGTSCCQNCVKINRIQSFRYVPIVAGVPQPAVTIPFTNNFLPGDPNFTYLPQLDGMIRQINNTLGGSVASYIKGRDCCDSILEVIHCNTFELLDQGGVPIASTQTNPLNIIQYSNTCGPCYDNGSSWTPTCGIRVIGKPTHPTIGCKSPRNQLAYEAIDIEVDFVDGWENTRTFVRQIQKAQSPKNTGYHMFYADYEHNHAGGHGRPQGEYNEWLGMPFPELTGRIDGMVDKCQQGYCVMTMVRGNKGHQLTGGMQVQNPGMQPLGVDMWAVSSTNVAAMRSLQDTLNAILACQGCPVKTPIMCLDPLDVLVDQDNASYPVSGVPVH